MKYAQGCIDRAQAEAQMRVDDDARRRQMDQLRSATSIYGYGVVNPSALAQAAVAPPVMVIKDDNIKNKEQIKNMKPGDLLEIKDTAEISIVPTFKQGGSNEDTWTANNEVLSKHDDKLRSYYIPDGFAEKAAEVIKNKIENDVIKAVYDPPVSKVPESLVDAVEALADNIRMCEHPHIIKDIKNETRKASRAISKIQNGAADEYWDPDKNKKKWWQFWK